MDKSIFATATITKKSENQDSKGEITTNFNNAILVADGLGSYKYAKRSSEEVIKTLLKQIKNKEDIKNSDFEFFFKKAQENLIDLSKQTQDNQSSESLFGTTLIVLIETERTIKIAYAGNGAIWHIRGNFADKFHTVFIQGYSPISLTWNAVNILNPHSIPENGKEALYRLISDNSEDDCIPTIIEIEKDCLEGDIIMICTDGIYSADQLDIRPSKTENIYVRYEKSIRKFFKHLKSFFETQRYSNEELNNLLNQYLCEIKPELEDDATIGVLVTKAALDYNNRKSL